MQTAGTRKSHHFTALLMAGIMLAGLTGCSSMSMSLPWRGLGPDLGKSPVKRTVGRAMVREEVPLEIYARPGAGGVGPDGRLVVASSAKYRVKPKRPVDACGNPITPVFNSAELNDDQRTLNNLIAQQERQLNAARRSAYTANSPALKDVARGLASQDKLEIERLRHLRKQLCKDAAHAIAASEKAAHIH